MKKACPLAVIQRLNVIFLQSMAEKVCHCCCNRDYFVSQYLEEPSISSSHWLHKLCFIVFSFDTFDWKTTHTTYIYNIYIYIYIQYVMGIFCWSVSFTHHSHSLCRCFPQVLKKLEEEGLHQAVRSTTTTLEEIPPPTLDDPWMVGVIADETRRLDGGVIIYIYIFKLYTIYNIKYLIFNI